jgi:hypothetical protein
MTIEDTLRWAYEHRSKPIMCASVVEKITGVFNGLSAYDRHVQAVSIIDLCRRHMPPMRMAYIDLMFGRESSSLEMLVDHLVGISNNESTRRGICLIVRSYCGEKIGLREIRKTLGCGMLKAASTRNQIYDVLDNLHIEVVKDLEALFSWVAK